jgi:hypothetical protein
LSGALFIFLNGKCFGKNKKAGMEGGKAAQIKNFKKLLHEHISY